MSKLQNIKAIRQMLDGSHRTQTRTKVGFADAVSSSEKNQKREVGDTWEEYDEYGNVVCIWEQKKGYRVRTGVHKEAVDRIREYLNSYPNCLDDCKTQNFTKLDQRFRAKFGRCADCQFRVETRLKSEGKFKDFEREQMLANAEAFFKQADVELDLVAKQLEGELHYANVGGDMEKWTGDPGMAKKIREEYEAYKKIALEKLNEYGK